MKSVNIGAFEIVSNSVVVSDYGQELGCSWDQIFIENVRNGVWAAAVIIGDNDKVVTLLAFTGRADQENGTWEETKTEIEAASGTCGMFDASRFQDDSGIRGVTRLGSELVFVDEPFQSECLDRILNSKHSAGVIKYGCIAALGGDGRCRCYTQKDQSGYVIGIKVELITDVETDTD
jgi:hypothetical protein